MTSITLELPEEVHFNEGDEFSVSAEGMVADGKLVVKRMNAHSAAPISPAERAAAVERFLKRWSGSLGNLSDKEVDEVRWEAVKEKYGIE